MMNTEKMRQALTLSSIDIVKHYEKLRNENADVLEIICPNQEARNFFTEFSFDAVIQVGEYCYNQANCFKKDYTWDDDLKRALKANLLLVGSGINGDIVALDLNDYQVGILFHDYFWGDEEEDPRKFLIKMNCSLGEFYFNSSTIPDYPIDAYEAAAYMGSSFTGYQDIDSV